MPLVSISFPSGLVAMLMITNFWPTEEVEHMLCWKASATIGFIGGILCSSGLLVVAVQQAGSQACNWNSPAIVTALLM